MVSIREHRQSSLVDGPGTDLVSGRGDAVMEPFTQLAMPKASRSRFLPPRVATTSQELVSAEAGINFLQCLACRSLTDRRSLIANLRASAVLVKSPRPKARYQCLESQICMRGTLALSRHSRFPSDLDP